MNHYEFDREMLDGSIISRFKSVVTRFPTKIAIQSDTESITYGELDIASDHLAHSIINARGTDPEPIAFILPQAEKETIALLAILKSGKWYIPVSRKLPAAQVSEVFKKANVRCLITEEQNRALVEDLHNGELQVLYFDRGERNLPDEAIRLLPDTMAAAYFTSGSTGEPKGVLWDHRAVLHGSWINIKNFPIGMDDRHSLIFSLTAAASVSCLFGTLLSGASLYVFDASEGEIGRLTRWIRENRITIFYAPVSLFRKLLDDHPQKFDLPDLRMVIVGGQALFNHDIVGFRKKFPSGTSLVNRMALSEAGGLTYFNVTADYEELEEIVPVGYPVEDKEIYLIDSSGKPLKTGEIGEIAVKSHFLSPGYLCDPELTSQKFKQDPDGGGKRIFLSGDLGRILPDGCLLHLGRKDFAVKIRGYRVELEAIERAINSLESVKESAVIACDRPGSGEKYIVAYLTTSEQPLPNQADMRKELGGVLPEYMIPSVFVLLDKFPLTHTGKIDRGSLPKPDRVRPDLGGAYHAPGSTIEKALVSMVEKVLDMSGIGTQDNFFDLGGNSLQAMELHQNIEIEFITQIPIQTLFQDSTVAGMSKCIDMFSLEKERIVAKPKILLPLCTTGTKPILFLIHGMNGQAFVSPYFLKVLGEDQPVFAFQASGLEKSWRQFPTIKKMADQYINAMREVQPAGPYLIGSTCAGGVVSFEMAHQLRAHGETVGPLIMIDPPLHIRKKNVWVAQLKHYYNLMIHRKSLYAKWGNRFEKRRKEGRIKIDTSDAKAIMEATSTALSFHLALKTYHIPPYDGTILLLSSRERLSHGFEHAKQYMIGDVQTFEVCNNHRDIHKPDNKIFTEDMRTCMKIAMEQLKSAM